jgi:hypothetical protein
MTSSYVDKCKYGITQNVKCTYNEIHILVGRVVRDELLLEVALYLLSNGGVHTGYRLSMLPCKKGSTTSRSTATSVGMSGSRWGCYDRDGPPQTSIRPMSLITARWSIMSPLEKIAPSTSKMSSWCYQTSMNLPHSRSRTLRLESAMGKC